MLVSVLSPVSEQERCILRDGSDLRHDEPCARLCRQTQRHGADQCKDGVRHVLPDAGCGGQIGRVLDENDDSDDGDHPVAVISDGFWKCGLGCDPAALYPHAAAGREYL